jgi:hypothetical protein
MSASPAVQPQETRIAAVIVNYRTPELTMRCLAALKDELPAVPDLRAVVVDGGSADGSQAKLAEDVAQARYREWVSFLPLDINGGFGWANNQAILKLAREEREPDFIYLLNPDAEVTHGAVPALLEELLRHPRCAAAGSQLLNPDGSHAASAFRFPSVGREFINAAQSEKLGRLLGVASTVVDPGESVEVDWVTGASVMLRADALRESGLFDDGFFLYFDEVELMHRLRSRGWSVRHVPQSRVVHAEGSSTGLGAAARTLPRYWYESRRRYFALTRGRAGVLAANLAALAGSAVAGLKKLSGRSQSRRSARAADLVRSGFWPSGADTRQSAPGWDDASGRPPAWTRRP